MFSIYIKRILFFIINLKNYIQRFDFSNTKRKNKICIVFLDQIGDFLIFSSSLPRIRQVFPEKEWEITLLGLTDWQDYDDVFIHYYCDKRYFINFPTNSSIFSSLKYLIILVKLSFFKFNYVVNPISSRTFYSDLCSHLCFSKTKIAIKSPFSNKNSFLFDYIYTDFFNINNIIHESEVFTVFFDYFFSTYCINIDQPTFRSFPHLYDSSDEISLYNKISLSYNYLVISPISGSPKKNYSLKRYSIIINELRPYFSKIYVIGSRNQLNDISKNLSFDEKVINLCGLLNLREVSILVHNSSLVLSNDSMVIHLAHLLSRSYLCILPGMDYGRYLPYPNSRSDQEVIDMGLDCFNCGWRCPFDININDPFKCVNDIPVQKIINKIMLINKL